MLVKSDQMILEAQKNGYAIGSFNTSDLEITQAIVAGAEAKSAPVIVETSEKAIGFAGLKNIASIVRSVAQQAKVPVALHLDHGSSAQRVKDCIDAGYTSVMFDGSHIPFEENINTTKEAVDVAHALNVPIEGELGAMGKSGESASQKTNPDEVSEFVTRTAIDFLAVSIGSVHGIEEGKEKLDIELLKKIHEKTNIPLVLHGSSGVSDEDIIEAIKNGISKINMDTDIRFTFARTIKKLEKEMHENKDPREIMGKVKEAIQKLIEEKIELFGSARRAQKGE